MARFPNCRCLKASSTIFINRTFVEVPGPPVSLNMVRPYILKEAIVDVMTTNSIVGLILGNVICTNQRQRLAPSREPASYSSSETSFSALIKITMLKPIVHHKVAIAREIHAHGMSVNHGINGRFIFCKY